MSSGNAILSEQLPAVEGATAKVQGAPVTTGLSVGALGLTSPMSMTALDQGVSSLQSSESASSLMSAQAPMTSSGFEDYAPLSPTFKEPTPSTKLEDITGTLPMLGSIQGPTQVPDQGTSQLPEPMSDTLSGPMSTPVITPTITPTTTPTTTPYLAPSIGPFVAGTPFVPPMPSFGGAGGGGGQMRGRRKYTQTLPVGLDISFGGVASEMFGRSNAPTRQSAAKFKAPKMPKTSVTKMPTLPGMPKKRKAKRPPKKHRIL